MLLIVSQSRCMSSVVSNYHHLQLDLPTPPVPLPDMVRDSVGDMVPDMVRDMVREMVPDMVPDLVGDTVRDTVRDMLGERAICSDRRQGLSCIPSRHELRLLPDASLVLQTGNNTSQTSSYQGHFLCK